MLLCCMETVKDVFNKFRSGLAHLYDEREIEALSLTALTEITGISKGSIKAFPEKELTDEQAEQLNHTLNELTTGKPLQYILGETEFYGLIFKVNEAVLIPRPETEELVEWVINSVGERASTALHPAPHILDIGTGSGCIAISLKKNLPEAHVSAIDISAGAIWTAKENALLNDVQISFIQDDILQPKFETEYIKFDIIVSNPPYVTLVDKEQMHTNVTDFEPHTALFVPENDPLLFYNAIADFAIKHLAADGLLFFEINESYGKETIELLSGKLFKNIELRKDMSDRDRMIKAVWG
jgi:release factor glutamine methyltransferase